MADDASEPGDGAGRRRNPVETVTWPVQVAAAWTWRILLIGLGIYIVLQLFLKVELVAFSFVLALFFTSVLHPLERSLRRLPGPRSLSAAIALLIGIAILGGIGTFVTWQISAHSSQLGDQITALTNHTKHWLQHGPLHLKSADLNKIADNIQKAVQSHQDQLISGAIATVQTVLEGLGALLLIILSTFFLLRDGEQIWNWTLRLFPRSAHDRVDIAARAGWRTLGGYMRGQVVIALFHGVSVTVVLLILRVPLAAALGVLIFLGSFIPLVGLTVTGALCTAVALLEHGITAAIVVAAAIIVLVQLEAHLLQPIIMSRSVQVHPLAIALAVLAGTTLSGIVGALLAVPLVAFVNTTIGALRGPQPGEEHVGSIVTTKASPFGDPIDPVDDLQASGGTSADDAPGPSADGPSADV